MTVLVLDVGKTHAKLTAWSGEGEALEVVQRENVRNGGSGARLDMAGIADWFAPAACALAERHGPVSDFVPVGHGAAAALIGADACEPPVDYEAPIPREIDGRYEAQRDDFQTTGSPSLGAGLNLGRQLMVARSEGRWPDDALIVPWPQVWAWRLTGIRASEVTSLGCHTDLWNPWTGEPSPMARSLGWDTRLAPLRHAADVLGLAEGGWARSTGLDGVRVRCGLHDSNAALWGARALPLEDVGAVTVLSTGTWFVAMRALGPGETGQGLSLGPDDVTNVDVEGRPTPSARFMGGRWSQERLGPLQPGLIDPVLQLAIVAAVDRLLRVGGVDTADDDIARLAGTALALAQEAAAMLDRIDSRGTVVVEGVFGRSVAFLRALATVRPGGGVYTVEGLDLVGLGALRLVHPALCVRRLPEQAAPLDPGGASATHVVRQIEAS